MQRIEHVQQRKSWTNDPVEKGGGTSVSKKRFSVRHGRKRKGSVPDLSPSNWVPDLLPLLVCSDKTMCGQGTTVCACECVFLDLMVFSFQNDERLSCSAMQRAAVLAGHGG